MSSGLSGPWLTANSALVLDGSSHKADGRVSTPASGYNDYTAIDAGREPVGLGLGLGAEWDARWLGELWVGQAAQAFGLDPGKTPEGRGCSTGPPEQVYGEGA